MTHAITANRLIDGLVVYRTATGSWSVRVADAAIFATEALAEPDLAGAKADILARLIVDPYLIVMDLTGPTPKPKLLKEAIRAFGPTIRYGADSLLEAAE